MSNDIFNQEQAKELRDNLDPRNVKQLTTGSKAQYIEGWHAINEANRIFGFGGWDRELVRSEQTNCELVEVEQNNRPAQQWRVGYLCTVRITVYGENGQMRKRDGTGFGTGYAKPNALGEAIESAVKEAETDAMKRALMTFGNPFGLALYDKKKAHVGPSIFEDEEQDAGSPDAGQREQPETQQATAGGQSPRSPAAKPTLSKGDARADNGAITKEIRACKTVSDLKKWGSDNADRVKLQPADWRKEIRKEYEEKLEELRYMEDSSRDADRAFEQ